MLHAHPRVAVAIPLPRRLPKVIRPALEAAIEQHLTAVDGLVKLLDMFDGDADSEPSIGAQDPAWESTNQEFWASSNDDDREGDEHDGREPDVDDEPSLAHTLDIDQARAARHATGCRSVSDGTWFGMSEDLEAEHDGREPACEDEGAQCEDEGAQCEDEGSVERCAE